MEKLKSNLQNMVIVLVGVALICGGLLAYINNVTQPAIQEQAEKALAEGIKAVLAADNVTVKKQEEKKRTVNGKELTFVIYDTDKGVAVQSTDPNGFGGNLTVLVGFDAEGTILGYTVLEHAETPGLGAKAPDWFQKDAPGCIVGLNPAKCNLTVSKDGGDIDAITASTITSRSFLRAVQQAYNTYKEECTDGNTGATSQNADGCTGATKQEN
ncbi:MAG: RnfABCDGE type electron transport complex subunit G [Prevotella sp.]|nr:RnfABCDGE type electron transport complex subunit G [Candidatus Prevotella equi]